MITFYTDKEGKRHVHVGSATPRKNRDVRLKNMNRAQRRSLLYGHTRIKDKILSLRKGAKEAGIILPRAKGKVSQKQATGYYSTLLNIVRRELSRECNELGEEV